MARIQCRVELSDEEKRSAIMGEVLEVLPAVFWIFLATNRPCEQFAVFVGASISTYRGEGVKYTMILKPSIGDWFVTKYRSLAAQNGTYATAKRMRKDGCPISVALAVLCGR